MPRVRERLIPFAWTACLSFLFAAPLFAQEHHAGHAGHSQDLGAVSFPISCSPAVQERFNRAVALLHHMMYVESQREFEAIAQAEPGCAMAHWGIAMTLFQPLWPTRPDAEQLKRGWALAEKARSLGPATGRERAYVDAVAAFYSEPEAADYRTRLQRFETGMQAVYRAYPEDREAAAFYALSHLATAAQTDKTLAHQKQAAEILDRVYAREPTHPGAVHYSIHAHDVEGFAKGGVEFARGYDDIAPTVPHALHMPTHIFVRTGEWDEVITWNRRSADAALNFPVGDLVSHHYPHAIDYLIYAYLQRADDAKANDVMRELASRHGYQRSFISAYALAAVPARYVVERREWAAAAALPVRDPAAFPWERFPGAEAMTHFARGLGAARSGDAAAVRGSLEALETLRAAAAAADDAYWARQIEIQRLAVAAWIARAEGKTEEALRLMRASAELEASTEKHPVTPGALQPAYELLGDLLLAMDRPKDALAAYERSLETWPDRFNSLLGVARAAKAAGDAAKAGAFYRRLVEQVAPGADRAGLEEARSYLASR